MLGQDRRTGAGHAADVVQSLSSTDHRGRDIGILLAMVAALKLGYVFILTKKVS